MPVTQDKNAGRQQTLAEWSAHRKELERQARKARQDKHTPPGYQNSK